MAPTKRAAPLQGEEEKNNTGGDAAVTGRSTSTGPKRLRGGGVNNPYAKSNKSKSTTNNRASNPYANNNNQKDKKKKDDSDDKEEEDDDDNMIENYCQDEGDDDFMDEMEPVPEDINPASSDDAAAASAEFSDITEGMRKRWLRPANEVLDNSKDLSLQCLDMDMISGHALKQNPNENVEYRRVIGAKEGTVPVIRAFGVNAAGNSATVFIHGFTPYCYFALPPGSTFENTDENSTKIRMYLNQRLEGAARGGKLHEYCLGVQYVTEYKSIMGYESPHTHFFRVMVSMPTLIAPLKRIMEDHGGVNLPGVDAPQGTEYAAFECNVPYVLRYMIDNDISGAGWLTLPKTKYQVRETSEMKTHCQVRYMIT